MGTASRTIAALSSTWHWQNPLPRGYQLSAIACVTATRCVATGFDGSIVTTDDGGHQWTNRSTGITASLRFLACPDRAVCYALGIQGPTAGGSSQQVVNLLLKSTDAGATWHIASHVEGNTRQFADSLGCASPTTCFAGVQHYGKPRAASILRTADGGKTWQGVHIANIIGIATVVCPTVTICYARGANNAGPMLFRSRDSGKTWSASGLRTPKEFGGIACPGANTCFGTAWTCPSSGCWGIFRTTNGAKSWKKVAKSPGGHPLGRLACPSVTTCYVLAATGSNAYNTSVLRTTNSGTTWSVHHLPDSASEIVCPSEIDCFLNVGFTVLATHDAFSHTREALTRSPLHNLTLTGISCSSTTVCYAAGGRYVCESDGVECNEDGSPGATTVDGGRTWTPTPAPPDRIARLTCPSTTACYALAGPAGTGEFVERSSDGTRTWHRVFSVGGLSGSLTNLTCPTATTCYVTASGNGRGVPLAIFVTRDGGKHWTARRGVDALTPGTARDGARRAVVSVSCSSVTTCFVLAVSFHRIAATQWGATSALLVTNDGGTTWTRRSVKEMVAGDDVYRFTPPLACPTVTTCYVLLSSGPTPAPYSTGNVLVTHNGGASWRRAVLQMKAILMDMACPTAETCWVVGRDGIFATSNSGTTWQKQVLVDGTPPPPLSSIACPAADTCYAVGGVFYAPVTIVGTHALGGTP